MEYRLTTGNDPILVETETPEDNTVTMVVGDTSHAVRFDRISDHLIRMQVRTGRRTRQVKAFIYGDSAEKAIVIDGHAWNVTDLEAVAQTVSKGSAQASPDQVTPPMPAVVVKVSVAVGDRVEKGQEVVVVSAMKMESTLRAPFNGIVTRINAAVNDKVAPGQILVDIDEEEPADHE